MLSVSKKECFKIFDQKKYIVFSKYMSSTNWLRNVPSLACDLLTYYYNRPSLWSFVVTVSSYFKCNKNNENMYYSVTLSSGCFNLLYNPKCVNYDSSSSSTTIWIVGIGTIFFYFCTIIIICRIIFDRVAYIRLYGTPRLYADSDSDVDTDTRPGFHLSEKAWWRQKICRRLG